MEQKRSTLLSAAELTPELEEEINHLFDYHPWSPKQTEAGQLVRSSLAKCIKDIVAVIPPSADRSTAIRKIREARMDCMSALTHEGRY